MKTTELRPWKQNPKFYLAGCLKGDAWLGKAAPTAKYGYIALRVADLDFAQAFVDAIWAGYRIRARLGRCDRGYPLVRRYNSDGKFTPLLRLTPRTRAQSAAWLAGFFDSEGHVGVRKLPAGRRSWNRCVSFFSTNISTLRLANNCLARLSIEARIVKWGSPSSVGHKGTKQVYCLLLFSSLINYRRFTAQIHPSIKRKAMRLRRIPKTYHPDPAAYRREAQIRSAAAKHRKLMTVTLTSVVAGIRNLMARGVKPTQRACACIPNYYSIQRHFSQARLVSRARAG